MTCTAGYHDTSWAYQRYGCTCPQAVEAVRAHWRKSAANRRHERRANGQQRSGEFDTVAVDLACAGVDVRLTVAERTAAVIRLRRAGLSALATARRIGCSARTVNRHWAKAHAIELRGGPAGLERPEEDRVAAVNHPRGVAA